MTLHSLLSTFLILSLTSVSVSSDETTRVLELSSASPLSTSSSITRDIVGKVHLRFPKAAPGQPASSQLTTGTAPPSVATRVVINGGELTALARYSDGVFTFSHVKPGVYLLEIFHPDFVYPTYKLNVPADLSAAVQAVEYKHPGAPKMPALYPLEAFPIRLQTPGGAPVYFDERPKIYIISMLMNPMVLMMLCMGLVGLYMKSIPEEEKLAMAEEQRKMGIDPNNPLTAFNALMKGGPAEDEGEPSVGSTKTSDARQRLAAAGAAARER
jgi:hypothetical protein